MAGLLDAAGEERAVDAETEADPGQRLPAELGHEPVVAPAATDARLRAQAVVDELEGRLRVVVEPAHHPRVLDVGDAEVVEVALHRRVVRRRLVGEVVDHQRRAVELGADLGALVVEDPQRVDAGALAGGLVEVELLEEPGQLGAVRRPGRRVAEARDLQAVAAQAQRAEPGVGDGEHLRVEGRVVDADRLDADLLQLAEAAGLRALVAEERPGVAQLDRQPAPVEAVLDDRTHDARRALGAQGDRAPAAVVERVHLLGDDVGRLAHATGVERGVLEDRQLDVRVAGAVGLADQRVADRRELRPDVLRDALGRGEAAGRDRRAHR